MSVLVAYPGPVGSHTAAAAAALFPSAPLVSMPSFRAVADAVARAEVTRGVLPIESSLAGAVAETHDLLYEGELSIVGETVIPIHHCLAALRHLSLAEIRIVRSHPAALEQCRGLLGRLEHAQTVAAASTADAAREAAAGGDSGLAVIASPEAADFYGLVTLEEEVGDGPAFTRFVTIAAHTWLGAERNLARTAFTFTTEHRPGALHAAIEPFARAGLDLLRLVSRPLPMEPWSYRFDAVVAGHPLDPRVRAALTEVMRVTRSQRVVGIYEAPDETR